MGDRNWVLLDEAYEVLSDAAAGVRSGDWQLPTPCADWTVAQVLQHAAMDQMMYDSAITGSEKPEGDAFNPTGDLGEDPLAYLASALSGTRDAFGTLAAGADWSERPAAAVRSLRPVGRRRRGDRRRRSRLGHRRGDRSIAAHQCGTRAGAVVGRAESGRTATGVGCVLTGDRSAWRR
jgi:hypothetical protein